MIFHLIFLSEGAIDTDKDVNNSAAAGHIYSLANNISSSILNICLAGTC